jgi:hypothetical protein
MRVVRQVPSGSAAGSQRGDVPTNRADIDVSLHLGDPVADTRDGFPVTTARPTPMNDDHGDQFPGAVPAHDVALAPRSASADERIVRMHAAYVQKANSLVEAGRESLAHELANAFALESTGAQPEPSSTRRTAGRRTPTRGQDGRRPESDTRVGRMSRITRSSLSRFDRYTLDVFNPRPPHGSQQPESSDR